MDRRTGPFFLHFSRFSPRSDTKDVWYILPWWRFKFFSREEWWMSSLKWKGFFFLRGRLWFYIFYNVQIIWDSSSCEARREFVIIIIWKMISASFLNSDIRVWIISPAMILALSLFRWTWIIGVPIFFSDLSSFFDSLLSLLRDEKVERIEENSFKLSMN